jgi:SAM-dependent methyltransferase
VYYRIFSKIYEIGAKKMCRDCQDFIEEGSKILDFGCGSGIVAYYFRDFFKAKVIGVDIKDNRIVDIPFKIFDGKNLPFENNSFDATLISYVLHHSHDPKRLLEEAKRVSKKIIIFEDLPEGILSKLRCNLHRITFLGGERKKFNFKTSKEWKEIFEKLRLKIIAQRRVFTKLDWLDPVKRILFILTR